MFLVAGLCMFAFVLLIAIVFVARSGGSPSPAQPSVVQQVFQPQPVYASVVHKTAREQDKEVQAALVAKWYAESLDEQFRKDTLDDIAAKLAARKS